MRSIELGLVLSVLLSCVAAAGCTTKYAGPIVTPAFAQTLRGEPSAQDIDVEVVPVGAAKGTVVGKLLDLGDQTVTLRLGADGSVPVAGESILSVPLANVRRIRATNHLNGALIGAAVGALAAVAAGVAVYAGSSDCGPPEIYGDSFPCLSPAFKGTFVTLLLGTPAALLGALIGKAGGTTTTYEFGAR